MTTLQEQTTEFLAQKRIAVVGLSRTDANAANLIYKKLKGSGHTVYAVNPNTQTIEGDPCYPDVKSLPQTPDGVVIVTRPNVTLQIVKDCDEAHIPRVWIHNSLIHGGTSLSQEAVDYCQQHGINLIAGGCPMMFDQPVDFGHQCMRWYMRVTKQLPE
ncbi:MAG TPA: CoA-binding protein [Phototrophicaceae bacterium]|nr:CoA-binding protein [Phototrophicaceae bacterium]